MFHARCAQVDREEKIAASHSELFTGFGVDPTAFSTRAARQSEDFARACARATDQSPWLEAALDACSPGTARERATFLTRFFGGEERV